MRMSLINLIEQLQAKLKYLSSFIRFLPSIDQSKDAVVGPDAVSNFLKNSDSFCRNFTLLEAPNSIDEQAILS